MISRNSSSSANLLFRRCDSRRSASMPWNPDAEGRATPGRRIQGETSAEALGDDIEDDVQAEPGAAVVAPRGKERIKGAHPDFLRHADAVVRNGDLEVVAADRPRANRERSGATVRIRMDHGVEEQICQHLAIGARIAVHGNSRRYVDDERKGQFPEHRAQAGDDLVGCLGEIELAALRMAAIHRNLLERLY